MTEISSIGLPVLRFFKSAHSCFYNEYNFLGSKRFYLKIHWNNFTNNQTSPAKRISKPITIGIHIFFALPRCRPSPKCCCNKRTLRSFALKATSNISPRSGIAPTRESINTLSAIRPMTKPLAPLLAAIESIYAEIKNEIKSPAPGIRPISPSRPKRIWVPGIRNCASINRASLFRPLSSGISLTIGFITSKKNCLEAVVLPYSINAFFGSLS